MITATWAGKTRSQVLVMPWSTRMGVSEQRSGDLAGRDPRRPGLRGLAFSGCPLARRWWESMATSRSEANEPLNLNDRWAVHARFERGLFGALARLARQGFVVPPQEGVDLIHDFFLEEWDGVLKRYDPTRGSLASYVYGAFIHFARRRILRLQRWAKCLANATQLAEVAAPEEAPGSAAFEPPSSLASLIPAFRRALAQLPPLEGQVLQNYLKSSREPERKLAQRFGLTRYRFREVLTDALGRLVAWLGEPGRLSSPDWLLAVALWREGRTVRQAAAHLRLSVPEVRKGRQRISRLLREGLGLSSGPLPKESLGFPGFQIMETPTVSTDSLRLFQMALLSPGDRALLQQVAEQATTIIDQLRADDFAWDERIQMIAEENPEWVSEVYQAIGKDESLPSEDREMLDAMIHAGEEDQAEVERAFELASECTGPERLNLLTSRVMRTPAFHPLGLAMMVFYAVEAVSQLISRILQAVEKPKAEPGPVLARFLRLLAERHRAGEDGLFVFIGCDAERAHREERAVVPNETLEEEIGRVVECPAEAAKALLSWLIAVASLRPGLFRGLEAAEEDGLIGLKALGDDVRLTLAQRWGLDHIPSPGKPQPSERERTAAGRGAG